MPTAAPAPAPVGTPAAARRRGAGRAPANPRAVTNFEEITAMSFVFARHLMHPEAHVCVNSIYSDAFLDMADLFAITDLPTRVTLLANPVAIVKAKI